MSGASADMPTPVTDLTVTSEAGDAVLEELVCEVCLGVVNEPKRLDCAHSFCRACLHRLLVNVKRGVPSPAHSTSTSRARDEANGANAVSKKSPSPEECGSGERIEYACPTCNKITPIPGGDVDRLSTSAALTKLLEISGTGAGWSDANREEMRQNIRQRRSSTISSASSQELSSCPDHGSSQEFYCVECKALVCGHCMLLRHKDHIDQVRSAQEAEDRMTAGLRSLMQPSHEAVFTASEVTGLISELKKELVKGSTTSTNHVKQYFSHVRELLEKREAELIARVEAESMKIMSDLTKKDEVMRRNVGLLSLYVDQVRATLHQQGDVSQLTSTHGLIPTVEYIHKQINNIASEITQQGRAPPVLFEGSVVDFSNLGSLMGGSEITGDGGYVIIKGSPPVPAERSPLHGSLLSYSSNSTLSLTTLGTIQEQDNIWNSSSSTTEPIYEEPMATTTYNRRSPKLPSRVSLTRQSAQSLKSSVTVSLKQVISCDAQSSNMKPCGVAVGEADAVIVSDIHSHCVKVIARSGKVMDTIIGPQSPEQIYGPVCLVTDSKNQLYILDKEGKKAIYRFKNGNFDNAFMNKVYKSYRLNQSWGMAVSEELIYVTDWQKSCIHIFQTSGKYKDVLNCGQQSKAVLKHPVGIAVTPDNSLVVADHESHCVWKVVHTKDVVEFQQIGSENILDSPYGVVVTREGYIVVTDSGNSQVCLFSPTGTFVTYLGKKGSGKGEFMTPRHVCATSKGEILVADEGNQRIQVFKLSR